MISDLRTDDFDFTLPPERIAVEPARPRDAARMLLVRGGTLADRFVRDLPELLQPGDVLVFNDTRVIPSRLYGMRGAARIEALLHRHVAGGEWRAFAKPGKRLRVGDVVEFAPGFSAEVTDKADGGEVGLRFAEDFGGLMARLEQHGHIPLPPYIARPEGDTAQDRSDYQTVFAREPGAVAAPTAGLHFTPDLLAALDARGVERIGVTLHVGAGTFLPVKAERLAEHVMHAERGVLPAETAAALTEAKRAGRRIVAVGTTSLRLLESAALPDGTIQPFSEETSIFITPGYRFRAVDLLMTNFHLPRSTLFMLVSAFAGMETMKAAYAHAIAQGYRFYSYGDSSLLDLNRDAP